MITGNGIVLGLVIVMAVVVGVVIGALAVRSGHWYGKQPEPPKPPGRHSRRPDGGPERRRDYLEPGTPGPASEAVTEQLGAVRGPVREAVRPLGGAPGVIGRSWQDGMAQPETREMTAPRPSPDQDMERWRQGQRDRDDQAEHGWPH